RHGPDRRRFYSGHGLADQRGTLLGRQGPAYDARALDLQDPGMQRPAARVQRPHRRVEPQSRGRGSSFQGRWRAAADAGDFGVPRDQGRDRRCVRLPDEPATRCAGDARARPQRHRRAAGENRRAIAAVTRGRGMTGWLAALNRLAETGGDAVLVTVVEVKGSTPREAGAKMVVTRDKIFDTVGGGHLELKAIELSRAMLRQE